MARIALCQDVMVEYMGYMALSSVLKSAGHEVDIFFDKKTSKKHLIHELRQFKPDIVGFSILSPSVPWALSRAKQVKKELNCLTIFGNIHAMMNPEEIISEDGVDIVCIGEGEHSMLELSAAIDSCSHYADIKGLWVKHKGKVHKNDQRKEMVNMEEMPIIDRKIYNKYGFFRSSPYLRVMTGRGCPFRCSFCSNTIMMDHYGGAKRYIRKQSPEKAAREIEQLVREHPRKVKHIFFIDEVFWVKNSWLREFLPLYKEKVGLPFTANFRFGGIEESDIKLLSECGASGLSLSTETGDERQRLDIMNKPVKNEKILKIAGWMHKYGIPFGSSVFFGLPGDTVDDHIRRLDFFRKINPTYLWTTFFEPYPKLPLNTHPAVSSAIDERKPYSMTLHHDMNLKIPDKKRLIRLKKVYFLMMKFPLLEKPLRKLINYNIPFFFDILFLSHFTYYIFIGERISFYQYLVHLKTFAINPLLRKKWTPQNTGRPYIPKEKNTKKLIKTKNIG